jgi:two-component system cell cycle response regulator
LRSRMSRRMDRQISKRTVPFDVDAIQILVASGANSGRRLILRSLEHWGFNFSLAEQGEAACRALESKGAPRLVLLEWAIPGMSGFEVCERIRARTQSDSYVYVIVLTERRGRMDVLEAMATGADDCLLQPFDPSELKSRLMVGRRIVLLQKELIVARESLRTAATHDSMTGLLNRIEIISFLRQHLARGRREGATLGVILANLDHFKKINTIFGHAVGDAVLQEAARRFRAALLRHEQIGRYGGDEFLLVLPGCDLASSASRADAVRTLIGTQPMLTLQGPVDSTVSMGVTFADAGNDLTLEALLERADVALRKAKVQGRNRVEIWNETSDTEC